MTEEGTAWVVRLPVYVVLGVIGGFVLAQAIVEFLQ